MPPWGARRVSCRIHAINSGACRYCKKRASASLAMLPLWSGFGDQRIVAAGKLDAGIAKQPNPFDTRWVAWLRGVACFTAHRYDEAIVSLRQARGMKASANF